MTRNRRHPFGLLLNEMSAAGNEFAHLFGRISGQPDAATFPLNVWQDDNTIFVEADLPGVDRATLEVTVTEGDKLTIRTQRPAPAKVEGVTWLRQERLAGTFARVIGLPFPVDSEKVEATYNNGVLKVTLPKVATVKPRTVPVKVGE